MSYYNVARNNQYCVNAKSPTASPINNQAYFAMKIGRAWQIGEQKNDLGYSAIGRKHGLISSYAKTLDGKQLSYFLADSQNIIRLNFEDQQVFSASSLRIRLGKDEQIDFTLPWDGTSWGNGYNAEVPGVYDFFHKFVGATTYVRITVS